MERRRRKRKGGLIEGDDGSSSCFPTGYIGFWKEQQMSKYSRIIRVTRALVGWEAPRAGREARVVACVAVLRRLIGDLPHPFLIERPFGWSVIALQASLIGNL